MPRAPAPISPKRIRSLAPRIRLPPVCPAATAALTSPPRNSRRFDTHHLLAEKAILLYSGASKGQKPLTSVGAGAALWVHAGTSNPPKKSGKTVFRFVRPRRDQYRQSRRRGC